MIRRLCLGIMTVWPLLGPLPALADEEPLGRLFFTPEQRRALDAGKRLGVRKSPAGRSATPRGPRAIELNGIVLRSDGSRTVWINNQPYQDRDPSGMKVEVRDPAKARIRMGRSGPAIELQVGEKASRRPPATATDDARGADSVPASAEPTRVP